MSSTLARRPAIAVHELPAFASRDLATVRAAFASVLPCVLRQAWRKRPEPDFAPGTVRLGWRGTSLLALAELCDRDMHNAANRLNQRTWELGDTFEIFLCAANRGAYVEFHITPGNRRLQLRIPAGGPGCGAFADFLIPGRAFRSATWVQRRAQRWYVYAEIPMADVGGEPGLLRGRRWRFSFGRYDYTRPRRVPVISSTSPHRVPDFHRRQEWSELHFS